MDANTRERQRILDGIETLYPSDSADDRIAFIGQVLLHHALENTMYNWRELPLPVLRRFLAICEDYERKSAGREHKESTDKLPGYLRH